MMSGAASHDIFEGVDPRILDRHHGVAGRVIRRNGQQGAGHSDSDSDSDSDGEDVYSDQEDDDFMDQDAGLSNDHCNFNKLYDEVKEATVKAPKAASPFRTSDEERTFFEMVSQLQHLDYRPTGYGICPNGWETGLYPDSELISVGFRARRTLAVNLPREEWLRRAVCWSQALDMLNQLVLA